MNPLAEALRTHRFCYVVELVASALRREAQVLEAASRLASLPQVVAGSITSYAGGAIGHDPIRVGTAARARGLTPNIHLTCVSQDRRGLTKTLADLHALGIENVFALTGDYPKAESAPPPVFDLDSVQLVRLIADLRRQGMRFHVAVAVSPFKYVEADCAYQYLKLEKKVAAGADCAVTQVGWDARKLRELITYLRERDLDVPVLGNVYALGLRASAMRGPTSAAPMTPRRWPGSSAVARSWRRAGRSWPRSSASAPPMASISTSALVAHGGPAGARRVLPRAASPRRPRCPSNRTERVRKAAPRRTPGANSCRGCST
jgi:5,10-methylenetetrahydrofolate reductase